jgi:hypothetical protein
MKLPSLRSFHAVLFIVLWALPSFASSINFTLAGDPYQTYSFFRSDAPIGTTITEPVGPYPGYLGSQSPGDFYGFFCIDFLKTANWNTTYKGSEYDVGDAVPGKTTEQLLEAAYLANKLYWLGGRLASTAVYQGPISFAVWQIMDPVPGDVPRDPSAQQYVLEAQQAFEAGLLKPSDFPNTRIFVPDNGSIQGFMTVIDDSPEPATIILFGTGLLLIVVRKVRLRRGHGKRSGPL